MSYSEVVVTLSVLVMALAFLFFQYYSLSSIISKRVDVANERMDILNLRIKQLERKTRYAVLSSEDD